MFNLNDHAFTETCLTVSPEEKNYNKSISSS